MNRQRGIEELEALYRQRYPAFVRVASAIAGDEVQGADAVQDAFASAIASFGSFRREAPLEAWVWRIVIRSAGATRRSEERTAQVDRPSPNGNQAQTDEASLRAMVASLPERQRLAIFLRYFADLDYRRIATVLSVEVGTVSATLNAAHAALRHKLEEARS